MFTLHGLVLEQFLNSKNQSKNTDLGVEQSVGVTLGRTHCFADMSADFLSLIVNAIVLLVLLWQGVCLSVVSFGIAVDMQDVCGAQRPVKQFVCWATAAGQLRLLTAACLLRAGSHHLILNRLWRTDVHRRQTVLLFFQPASSVRSFLGAGFGLRSRLGLGVLLLLRLCFNFHCV